ncbi:dihydroceramide fatty acyl 2-hydroxylase FAH1 [Physcomitrium patens]|uniref:Fatty acid hydroxylase domain-containing protein n=1 Tax=Physcomitrium patens TaxID=3218 RepID=A0A2K1KUR9_PHYPA|nr:dihydroceramide fatty acyl 2-hydroxylase FAH1-like [Physcomitrium patens]XP_024370192.1 dihydroceramide fatty acyl 2-hydroxylase FAH1-like [Physcomitrium patens]XP_024370193.1 dihydroceramide fatty acyl 2-hydroxylase FAH1-like [Physcomitrium patens]PNR57486.1 hypothetical protein PHYPA_004480 [Physcomitrium patens]|eukprot:XP_024370191.1 dihydroceramide fatty acyl 2-hydroxylase FAH1-like [Physcomitrella patens]
MAVGMARGEEVQSAVNYDSGSKSKYSVDMTKPMVAQVGHLGAYYDEWVHQPVMRKGSPRFFHSNVLEMGTKAKWWMIPGIWGPAVAVCVYRAVSEGLPLHMVVATFCVGLLMWTLVEYILHRFLFHMKTSSYWSNTIHYVLHGFHHKHPMDSDRLVFPPLFALSIIIPVWFALQLVVPSPAYHSSLFGGLLSGYILYDVTHYYLHFGMAFTPRLHKMKKDHSDHHFKNQLYNYSFGVTSPFWDIVFNTLPPSKAFFRHIRQTNAVYSQ